MRYFISTSQEFYAHSSPCVMFCCGLVPVSFGHIFQGVNEGTLTNMDEWITSNPCKCNHIFTNRKITIHIFNGIWCNRVVSCFYFSDKGYHGVLSESRGWINRFRYYSVWWWVHFSKHNNAFYFVSFLNTEIVQVVEISLVLNCQCNSCWCLAEARRQNISNYAIDLIFPKYSDLKLTWLYPRAYVFFK